MDFHGENKTTKHNSLIFMNK